MKQSISEELITDRESEKLSSAFTLSDMEIFIFPELFYPLVLANIMSPVIWSWLDDPWFSNIEKKGFTWKSNRIKQYIIQNYVFNLDLATWGLTTKEKEISRFSSFFDMEMLKQSNALFGYEGDKYYFDIDIRKHFGLDKFNSNIIPYWKTETIEAMGAFRHKENFTTGAGECVSLSALYAAAMFVVGKVPLEKIFLIATPLHSQNFICEKDGLITNNRRIVTKNMWFNGTSLSAKARRALENEKVSIVSHISGYIHTLYSNATIDPTAYSTFSRQLRSFLVTGLTKVIFINFLRFKSRYKSIFQFRCECSGSPRYIPLEKLFEYEHGSKFSVSEETREQLISEMEGDEFHLSSIPGLILLNDIEKLLDQTSGLPIDEVEKAFSEGSGIEDASLVKEMFREIREFISTEPRLPSAEKNFIKDFFPQISVTDTREKILSEIKSTSVKAEVSRLALYVYRQMDHISWEPFIKAAIERNPVCYEVTDKLTFPEVHQRLLNFDNTSIYDSCRLAQPDEVWNFRRGDGIEKSLLLASVILHVYSDASVTISIRDNKVSLLHNGVTYDFESLKGMSKKIEIIGNIYNAG